MKTASVSATFEKGSESIDPHSTGHFDNSRDCVEITGT